MFDGGFLTCFIFFPPRANDLSSYLRYVPTGIEPASQLRRKITIKVHHSITLAICIAVIDESYDSFIFMIFHKKAFNLFGKDHWSNSPLLQILGAFREPVTRDIFVFTLKQIIRLCDRSKPCARAAAF